MAQTNEPIDIAIVGAGITGLYTAWRMAKDKENDLGLLSKKIKIFDAMAEDKADLKELVSAGRLRSVTLPGVSIPAELGAMRFSGNHLIVDSLFNEGFKFRRKLFDIPPAAYFLRGQRFSSTSLLKNANHIGERIDRAFHLREDEGNKLPSDLIRYVIDLTLKELDFSKAKRVDEERFLRLIRANDIRNISLSWDEITENCTIMDEKLYKIGFWNLMQHFLTNEGFQLAHDGLGYESIVSNWNAAEAIKWFLTDFEKQEFYMLPEGFASFANRLKDELNSSPTVERLHEHKLTSLMKTKSGEWELTFNNDMRKLYKAQVVILALPYAALNELTMDGLTWEAHDDLKTSWGREVQVACPLF